jgi:hypothetical protein
MNYPFVYLELINLRARQYDTLSFSLRIGLYQTNRGINYSEIILLMNEHMNIAKAHR